MSTFSISGVVSGIDWDGMIDKLISNASRPMEVQTNKKTNLTNKKSLLEEMQTSIRALQNSLTALKLPSTYRAKSIDIERLDSMGSPKGVLTATVNADAEVAIHDLTVKQLARAQVRRSNRLEGGSLAEAFNSSDKLKNLTKTSFNVNVAGKRITIDVNKTDTLSDLADKINTKLKAGDDTGITASVVDNKLIFSSDYTGLGKSITSEKIKHSSTGVDTVSSFKIDAAQLKSGEGSIAITDANGKKYYDGLDFDVVGDEIRWRDTQRNSATAGEKYTVKYMARAGDVWEETVTRGADETDVDKNVLSRAIDFTKYDIKLINDKTGEEYIYGTDFRVNGGTSIRWLTTAEAERPEEDQTYTVKYTLKEAMEFDLEVERGSTDSVMTGSAKVKMSNLRPSAPSSSDYELVEAATIRCANGKTYKEGVEFDIISDADNNAVIKWRSEAAHAAPAATETYDLIFTEKNKTTGVEQTRASYTNLTRSNSDELDIKKVSKFTKADGYIKSVTWGDKTQDVRVDQMQVALATGSDNAAIKWGENSIVQASDRIKVTFETTDNSRFVSKNLSSGTFQITPGGTISNVNDLFQKAGIISPSSDFTGTPVLIKSDDQHGIAYDVTSKTPPDVYRPSNGFSIDYNTGDITFDNSITAGNGNYFLRIPVNSGLTRTVTIESSNGEGGIDALPGWMRYNSTTNDIVKIKEIQDETLGITLNLTNPDDINTRDVAVSAVKTGDGKFSFSWSAGTTTAISASDRPAADAELTVDYVYNANTFSLDDNGSGILSALGLDNNDEEHFTEGQDAILILNGQEETRSSNYIGPDYENELIKGMTIKLVGTGQVLMDVSHDMETAVEATQTVIDNYNDILSWINTRTTEKELDEDMAATVDSDDFRMRWGLLHGSSLLRSSKQQMRTISSQNYTQSFTQRTSSKAVYGTMQQNKITSNQTLTIKAGDVRVSFTITPDDTLETIKKKINGEIGFDGEALSNEDRKDPTKNPAYYLRYDDDGKEITPLVKAEVSASKLTLTANAGKAVSLDGNTTLLKTLGLNYSYQGLYQLGITTESANYGESGLLEFDTAKFMEVAEDNPEELQSLMISWATSLSNWTNEMLSTSADDYGGKGRLVNEIEGIDTQIDNINKYIKTFNERMDQKRESLQKRFTAAETAIAKLMNQSSTLSSMITMMEGNSGSSNSGSSSLG